MELSEAVKQSAQIRDLYHRLEEINHGTRWSKRDDMLGFLNDAGELGQLMMAEEGRWVHHGDLPRELEEKLADCLWWVLVLSERSGVDITKVFMSKMENLQSSLSESIDESAP
jgi:NTP pyrophosphatase (non-canonical NTP hydrolase)